jgi:hypothetical protein
LGKGKSKPQGDVIIPQLDGDHQQDKTRKINAGKDVEKRAHADSLLVEM